MIEATLCFPIRGNKILMGMKKIGFGKDRYNGFGGKLKDNETIEQATIRELYEETNGIKTSQTNLEKVAEIEFYFPDVNNEYDHRVHVYFIREWENEAKETNEMLPYWINVDQIPYGKMWPADSIWIPKVLAGEKVRGIVTFAGKGESVSESDFKKVSEFSRVIK